MEVERYVGHVGTVVGEDVAQKCIRDHLLLAGLIHEAYHCDVSILCQLIVKVPLKCNTIRFLICTQVNVT